MGILRRWQDRLRGRQGSASSTDHHDGDDTAVTRPPHDPVPDSGKVEKAISDIDFAIRIGNQ